jgi:urease accessory protein
MLRAGRVEPGYQWTDPPADAVVLDFDARHRRRVTMIGTRGLTFLLDLERATALRGGDALVLEDGRLVEVVAAPEPLVEVRGRDAAHLLRLAWHLGNRHLPTQVTARGLRIRRDHVIENMLAGLGARVTPIEAPFDPEGGAYDDGAESHAHAGVATSGDPRAGHGHRGDHAHDHAHHGGGDSHQHRCDHPDHAQGGYGR